MLWFSTAYEHEEPMTKKIIRLNAAPEEFGNTPDELTEDMFVSDLPVQHSHLFFEDEELGLYVGLWDTTDMIEAAGPYPCDEFMWLLEGEAAIKNCKTGQVEKVVAGQSFVIPKGYDCQWRQRGYLRKFFLISENPDEPVPEKPAVEGIIIPGANSSLEALVTSDPFRLKNGSAIPKHHVCYKDTTGKFLTGTWECDPFDSQPGPFPYHGLARVIAGSLILIDGDGVSQVFEPGDVLFVPEGVLCRAQAKEKVSLLFAILKPC